MIDIARVPIAGLPAETVRTPPFMTTTSLWHPSADMPRRPVLLDVGCGRGGAGVGYYTAGFDIVGVDIAAQPLYPFEFHQAEGVAFIGEHGHKFDAIHVSPHCEGFSRLRNLTSTRYPRMIAEFRDACRAAGVPYVIENVADAANDMHNPIMLCMSTWARRSYRHRLFESNMPLVEPLHFEHTMPQAKLGRAARPGEAFQAMGHFPQIAMVRQQMEMPWADRDGIADSIPPIYAEFVGRQLLARLIDDQAAAQTALTDLLAELDNLEAPSWTK